MATDLSDYEKQRLKTIAERQKYFNEFMKANGEETFKLPKVKPRKVTKPKITQKITQPKVDSDEENDYKPPYASEKELVYSATPTRRSARALAAGRRKYRELDAEDDFIVSDSDSEPGYVSKSRSKKRVLRPRNH